MNSFRRYFSVRERVLLVVFLIVVVLALFGCSPAITPEIYEEAVRRCAPAKGLEGVDGRPNGSVHAWCKDGSRIIFSAPR